MFKPLRVKACLEPSLMDAPVSTGAWSEALLMLLMLLRQVDGVLQPLSDTDFTMLADCVGLCLMV